MATFENLVLESNGTKILRTHRNNHHVRFFPAIESPEFEFRVLVRKNDRGQSGNFVLGLMSDKHPVNTYGVGGHGNVGWGIWIGHGQKHFSLGRPRTYEGSNFSKGKSTGIFGFRVNKKEKRIYFVEGERTRRLTSSSSSTSSAIQVKKAHNYPVIFENCEFPEKFHISVCLNHPGEVELISFTDHSLPPLFHSKGSVVTREQNERLDFLCHHFTNFEIPLQNKTLQLWRSLLLLHSSPTSKIPKEVLEKGERYEGLKHLNLDVDEDVILRILLEVSGWQELIFPEIRKKKKKEKSFLVSLDSPEEAEEEEIEIEEEVVEEEEKEEDVNDDEFLILSNLEEDSSPSSYHKRLIDYFIFFSSLGMKKEMSMISEKVVQRITSFKSLYLLFRSCVFKLETCQHEDDEQESEILKSWFTSTSPQKINPYELGSSSIFKSQLTFSVFKTMKNTYRTKISSFDSPFLLLPGIPAIIYHLKKLEDVKISEPHHYHSHHQNSRNLFSSLYNDQVRPIFRPEKKNRSNIVLKTRDGGKFLAHPEILIWRSNFFFRMIKFGGAEVEEMEKQGTITLLEELKEKDVSLLLKYYYVCHEGEEESEEEEEEDVNFEVLLRCIVHSHKFLEEEYTEIFLDRLERVGFRMALEGVKKKNKSYRLLRLEDALGKVGHLFLSDQLREHVLMRLVGGEGSAMGLKKSRLEKIMMESMKKEKVKNEERKLEGVKKELMGEIISLKEKYEEVVEKNQRLEERIMKLEKDKVQEEKEKE